MAYVDGFVLAVPAKNKQAFVDMAAKSAAVFKEHGATRIMECWGDDVPDGKLTDFKMAVKAKPDEVVVFSWIEWPSKERRDEGMQKAMEDPRMSPEQMRDVMDGKRMIYGGFTPVVDER